MLCLRKSYSSGLPVSYWLTHPSISPVSEKGDTVIPRGLGGTKASAPGWIDVRKTRSVTRRALAPRRLAIKRRLAMAPMHAARTTLKKTKCGDYFRLSSQTSSNCCSSVTSSWQNSRASLFSSGSDKNCSSRWRQMWINESSKQINKPTTRDLPAIASSAFK